MPASSNGRKQASNQLRAAENANEANAASPSVSPPAGNAAASSIFLPELGERGNSGSARSSISVGEGQEQQMNLVHNQQDAAATWCWQNGKNSVYERLAYLFNNSTLSDVTFVVGKAAAEERVLSHKFVLSMGSPVFDAMFNGNLATLDTEIHIPDIEPAAFSALLKFLYTDDFGDISHYSVMTTLYAAKKYSVPALQMACVEFLKRNLRADNAFLLVAQARLFDETELASLCMENIDQNTNEAINAEGSGFLELDHETLCAVLERDTLHIREIKLFVAIDKWAEQECIRQNKPVSAARKREVLGTALELIRFPVMTIEEFANVPARNGLLTDTEVKDLFLYFTLNPKPETRFLEIPRSCVVGKEYTVTRFQQTDNRWGYSGTADRIRFSVDRQIHVVGLGLYGSVHGPAEYLVTLQIILSSNQKVIAQHETNFSSDGSENIFRVNFKKPVEVQPGIHYTISSCLKGPDSFYGTRGIRKVIKQTSSQSPVVFNFIYSPGNNNGTSVEDGQIPEIVFLIP